MNLVRLQIRIATCLDGEIRMEEYRQVVTCMVLKAESLEKMISLYFSSAPV